MPRQNNVRRLTPLALGAILALAATTYQVLLTSEPLNDHFMNVVWGREILKGNLPVRDFFEAGEPLSGLISAGAETLVGYRLLSEALIVGLAVGISTWLVFRLTYAATSATAPAFMAGVLVLLSGTRSYSYPKVLLYAVAATFMWAYVRRRSWYWLASLCGLTALGFLWRHDHGVYLACGTAFAVLAAEGVSGRGLMRLAIAGALTLLLLSPYLAWVQVYRGLGTYLADGTGVISTEFGENRPNLLPPWPLQRLSDLARVEPRDAFAPLVRIRWTADSSDDERNAAMERRQLVPARPLEGLTSVARLFDPTPENVRALVSDPIVADTGGIDRSSATVAAASWRTWDRWRFRYWWLRMDLLPAFEDPERAGQVAAWMFITLPLAALLWAVWPVDRGGSTNPEVRQAIGATAGLLLVSIPGLLRQPLAVYAPDVVVLPAVLSGYMAWRFWNATGHRPPVVRIAGRVAVAGLSTLLVLAVSGVGLVAKRASWLAGEWESTTRAGLVWSDAWSRLTISPPIAFWEDKQAPATLELARYIHMCTAPDARLLVLAFAPELHYYADRAMASRHLLMGRGRWTSEADQKASLSKLSASPPPLVIARLPYAADEFPEQYPLLDRYLRAEYTRIGEIVESKDRQYAILRRTALAPVGLDPRHGWPCYTTERSGTK